MDRTSEPASCDSAARYVVEGLPPLLEVLRQSDVSELELQEGDIHVRLRRELVSEDEHAENHIEDPAGPIPLVPVVSEITAPLVGTFYRAATPGAPPLVAEGSPVADDTVVGIIEALHVLTEVEAGCSGTITAVLAREGQAVQYGQPLFEVTPGG